MVSAYTATSAAFLVISESNGEFDNIGEVITLDKKICIPKVVSDQFLSIYKQVDKNNIKETNSAGEVLKNMDIKSCDVGVLDMDAFRKLLVTDEVSHIL